MRDTAIGSAPRKARWRWFTRVASAALLVGAGAAASIALRVHLAERAFEESLGPLDSYAARYPPAEANDTAIRLNDAADAFFDRARDEPRVKFLMQRTQDYINEEAARESAIIATIPDAVARFLAASQTDIDSITECLLTDKLIRWKARDLRWSPIKLSDIVDVNLLASMKVTRLLVADAYWQMSLGKSDRAAARLDAAWRLMEAVRARPGLLAQLIAMSQARLISAALRKVPVERKRWTERLSGEPFRDAMAASFAIETWQVRDHVRRNIYARSDFARLEHQMKLASGDDSPDRSRWVAWIRTPVRYWNLPSYIEGTRATIVAACKKTEIDDQPSRLALLERRDARDARAELRHRRDEAARLLPQPHTAED